MEAFKDFISHLTPEGVYCVSLPHFHPPRETLRMCSLAFEALRELGRENPERHMFVVVQGTFLSMLIKSEPFNEEEIDHLERMAARKYPNPDLVPLSYFAYYDPYQPMEVLYRPYRPVNGQNMIEVLIDAYTRGMEDLVFEAYDFDVTPVYDDSPFFYKYFTGQTKFPVLGDLGLLPIVVALLQVFLLTGLFVFYPLSMFRRRGLMVSGRSRFVIVFACLGLGFMFFEISAMQRFMLYLGHPSYSVVVILASLLASAGLGSLVGERFDKKPLQILFAAVIGIAALALFHNSGMQTVFLKTHGMEITSRVIISVACVFPLGFFLGFPFPMALKTANKVQGDLVPWGWAINGAFSVLGGILSILLAMSIGFTGVTYLAAALYLVVLVLMRPLLK